MMRTQLHEMVAGMAAKRGDSPALTFKDNTVTYAELWSDVAAFGAALHELGLQRGERVAVYLDKRIAAVVAMFGASAAGGVFVPVNPLLKPNQVAYILGDCSVRVLVTTVERLELLHAELTQCPSLEHVIVLGAAPRPAPELECSLVGWDELTGADDIPEPDVIDVDMAAILYTSGSTGKPKGVVLSHRNVISGGESVSQYLANDDDDVILAALPLSFDAGFSQLTTAFDAGAHVVLVNYLLPGDVVRLCAKHRVTGLTCVPPLWIQLADQAWPPEATSSMRYFANTGGRMPKATLAKLRAIFPDAKPYLMYGLTEAFRSTYLDPAEVDRRPDSIGKAIPNAEILVVRENGSLCGPGEEGELVHRGALVAMGYWNDPARTAERFKPVPGREGAICTEEIAVWSGDRVVKDEQGFLFFVGRNDEMIKTSGYRVSPTEIEEVVYSTGLVRDAVALGVDDARVGQRIVLAVSPAEARRAGGRSAPRRAQAAAAAVHGPEGRRREARAAPVAQRQVRPQPAAPGAGAVMTEAGPTLGRRASAEHVGGIPLDRLAERVGGTPFFAYDRALLTERVALLRATLPAGIELGYAVKANPMPAVVQHLSGLVDSLDVASAAEMRTALDTPMSATMVSFAGPGKTPTELSQAIAAGVTIEMESETEAERVSAIGERLGIRPRVAVRVNPDFQVKGSGMRLGGGAQQFGIDSERVPALLAKLARADVEFLGFHIFAGSQNLNADILCEAQRKTVDLALGLADAAPIPHPLPEHRRRVRDPLLRARPTARPHGHRREPQRLAGPGDPAEPSGRPRRRRTGPLHRRRMRDLRDPGHRPQGVPRQDLPRRRRRAPSPARGLGQLRPGDPPQLPGGNQQSRGPRHPRDRQRRRLPVHAPRPARRQRVTSEGRRRRSRSRLPGRRLRPHREPHRLSEPPRPRRGADVTQLVAT